MLDQFELVKESDHLFRFAMRLCKDRPAAEDLLQATLLRAIEKKALFEEGSNVFKWASKIMFNTFVSEYRRKTKFETQYSADDFAELVAPEASSETKIELQEVERAMETISDEHRDVLVMVCVQGMQYQEAADVLGVPVGTVRSRLSRARVQLDAALETGQYKKAAVAKAVPSYLLAA